MNLITLETSTKNFSIACIKDGGVVLFRHTELKDVLSSSIIPAIDKVLKDLKIPVSKVDAWAVGLGPGSFTSLRVGLATVKGLCFATQKPIIGIPSLDALAVNAKAASDEQICTICDARRNLVYACVYEKKNGRVMRKTDYFLSDIASLLVRLKKKTFFIGDGIKLFKAELEQKKDAAFADEKNWYPEASALGVLAWQRFKAKKFDNVDKLIPVYVYPDDCQVRK